MSATPPPIPPALWRKPMCIVALGFGAGILPKAPGTWGTLLAVPVYFILQPLPLGEYAIVLLISFGAGVWWCGKTAQLLGVHDHPAIVWDEMVGYWITMIVAPDGGWWLVSGFVLFRLFDIWKPWPIRRLDKQVAGGLGIMVDDVVAGLYAALCLLLGRVMLLPG
jgi:phosphatidylglycerophosphatase A